MVRSSESRIGGEIRLPSKNSDSDNPKLFNKNTLWKTLTFPHFFFIVFLENFENGGF